MLLVVVYTGNYRDCRDVEYTQNWAPVDKIVDC